MILGTSAYKNGIRATTFRPEIDVGIGYLLGATLAPVVVRISYLDMHATERVALRARQVRETAGTLTGIAAVFADDNSLPWAEAAARLAQRFPDRWDGITAEALSADARARRPLGHGSAGPADRQGLQARRRPRRREPAMTPPHCDAAVTPLTCTAAASRHSDR